MSAWIPLVIFCYRIRRVEVEFAAYALKGLPMRGKNRTTIRPGLENILKVQGVFCQLPIRRYVAL